MALPVGIAPTTRRFEAGRSDLLSYGSLLKWCAEAVLPRLPPQCRCGDLLVIYRRVMPRAVRGDEMAAPDGFAPSTSRFTKCVAIGVCLDKNEVMSSPKGFRMDDVDTKPITRAIRCFTVGLGRENDLERENDPQKAPTIILIGSGTLVSWNGKVGILTASHVIEEGMLRDTATLHLGGDALGEVWQFEREHLKIHTIGKYSEATEESGPDLAVIELPLQGSTMDALKAKKSFYNLEKNIDPRIAEARDEKGLVALAGTLGETRKELGVANGLDQVRRLQCQRIQRADGRFAFFPAGAALHRRPSAYSDADYVPWKPFDDFDHELLFQFTKAGGLVVRT